MGFVPPVQMVAHAQEVVLQEGHAVFLLLMALPKSTAAAIALTAPLPRCFGLMVNVWQG